MQLLALNANWLGLGSYLWCLTTTLEGDYGKKKNQAPLKLRTLNYQETIKDLIKQMNMQLFVVHINNL